MSQALLTVCIRHWVQKWLVTMVPSPRLYGLRPSNGDNWSEPEALAHLRDGGYRKFADGRVPSQGRRGVRRRPWSDLDTTQGDFTTDDLAEGLRRVELLVVAPEGLPSNVPFGERPDHRVIGIGREDEAGIDPAGRPY